MTAHSGNSRAIPVLPVADMTRALAWYERLGFTVDSAATDHAVLHFDGAEVHLAEADHRDATAEALAGAYLRVENLDAVHAHWSVMGAPVLAPPGDQPDGAREFVTEDPDGNRWLVGGPELTTNGEPEAAAETSEADEPRVAEQPESGEERDWLAVTTDDQPCPDCGLTATEYPARALGAQVRDEAHAFGEILRLAGDNDVRRRPSPDTWSALEYGVHVRDVLAVFAERVVRTLAETEPELGWWDHEAAITDGLANESDVGAVADDLGRNAGKLSEALREVGDDDWERGATRREGERFTIESMAQFALHEVVHHLHDAQRSLGGG